MGVDGVTRRRRQVARAWMHLQRTVARRLTRALQSRGGARAECLGESEAYVCCARWGQVSTLKRRNEVLLFLC